MSCAFYMFQQISGHNAKYQTQCYNIGIHLAITGNDYVSAGGTAMSMMSDVIPSKVTEWCQRYLSWNSAQMHFVNNSILVQVMVSCTNVDSDLCRHMASLDYNFNICFPRILVHSFLSSINWILHLRHKITHFFYICIYLIIQSM